MEWKIVFSDIDGTVLNSKHELLTSTIEAVQKISFKKYTICIGVSTYA